MYRRYTRIQYVRGSGRLAFVGRPCWIRLMLRLDVGEDNYNVLLSIPSGDTTPLST